MARPCLVCGTPTPRTRCRRCEGPHKKESEDRFAPFYRTARWRRTSEAFRRSHPMCELRLEGCLGKATEVDHVVSMSDGGSAWDPANYRATCRECHARKTQADRARRAKARNRTLSTSDGGLPQTKFGGR